MRQDHRLRHDAAWVAHQVFEQRELARPQVEHLAAARHAPRQQIERDVVDREGRRFGGACGAPHQRLHPREQLREREGLRQVVVAAGLQAPHAIVDGPSGAEDENGRRDAAAAELVDERQAVALGQHQVDDRDVVRLIARRRQPRIALRRVVDGKPRFAQAARDEFRDTRIVFDDQRAHDPS